MKSSGRTETPFKNPVRVKTPSLQATWNCPMSGKPLRFWGAARADIGTCARSTGSFFLQRCQSPLYSRILTDLLDESAELSSPSHQDINGL